MFGGIEKFQTDPHWHDLIPFHEYFHGDNGAGIGASHQTGWTGTVALLFMLGGALHSEAGSGRRGGRLTGCTCTLPTRPTADEMQGYLHAYGCLRRPSSRAARSRALDSVMTSSRSR